MKYLLIPLIFAASIFSLFSQSDLNNYQDFDGTSAYVGSEIPMSGYYGEYQWFLINDNKWNTNFNSNYQSYKIEVVSFPFVANRSRTDTTAVLDRILTVPDTALSSFTEWSHGGSMIRRIDTGDVNKNYDVDNTPTSIHTVRTVNRKTVIQSQVFHSSTPTTGVIRAVFPHSVLRHTHYIHCGGSVDDEVLDSVSFIVDFTRGRMRYYPFGSDNYTGYSHSQYDITVRSRIVETDSFYSTNNSLGTYNCFDSEDLVDPGCFSAYYPEAGNDLSELYIRPSNYALSTYNLHGPVGNNPAGYLVDPTDSTLVTSPGIIHTYVVDQNIDLTEINTGEKVIYNPSYVHIEADNLVFPAGYTFRNVRAVYPSKAEVDTSSVCPSPEGVNPCDVIVPTDLGRAIYKLEPGSKLTIEDCVSIYDADIVVGAGSTLIYNSDKTLGDFIVVDSGGLIIESTGGLCNDCLCNQDYDLTGTITISTPVTWDTDLQVNATIEIVQGGHLTIENDATIYFADSKRLPGIKGIIVRPAGKLTINDATLTTNLCDDYWDGIQVHGDTAHIQTGPSDGSIGVAELNQGARIENARVGVYVGRYFPQNELIGIADYSVPFVDYLDFADAGGILIADGCTFSDNRRSVVFAAYEHENYSRLVNCNFIHDSFPSNRNYDFNNGLWAFVTLREVHGVDILGCTFKKELNASFDLDASGEYRGIGILSYNSEILVDAYDAVTIDSSRFINLYRGVDHYNWSTLSDTVIVKRSVFDRCIEGIVSTGGMFARVVDNTFITDAVCRNNPNIPPTSSPFEGAKSFGVFMNGSRSFAIARNTFLGTQPPASCDQWPTYGVISRDSKIYGGYVYKNDFSGANVGTQAEFDNTNLGILCNTYDDHDFAWYIGPSPDPMDTGTVKLGDQGISCDPAVGETAGNLFELDGVQDIRIDGPGVSFTYFANGEPPSTVPEVLSPTILNNCLNSDRDSCYILDSIIGLFLSPTNNIEIIIDEIEGISSGALQQQLIAQVTQNLVASHQTGKIVQLLLGLYTFESAMMLFEYCLEVKAYSDCQWLINNMPANTQEQQDVLTVYQAMLDVLSSGRNILEADTSEVAVFQSIASSPSRISKYAQSILAYLNSDWIEVEPYTPPQQVLKESNGVAKSEGSQLTVYPNPSVGEFTIVLERQTIQAVEIYDISGQLKFFSEDIDEYFFQIDAGYLVGLNLLKVVDVSGKSYLDKILIVK